MKEKELKHEKVKRDAYFYNRVSNLIQPVIYALIVINIALCIYDNNFSGSIGWISAGVFFYFGNSFRRMSYRSLKLNEKMYEVLKLQDKIIERLKKKKTKRAKSKSRRK